MLASPAAPDLTLLTFTRNDAERALVTIESVRPAVGQIVVVDSSNPETHAFLVSHLRHPNERIVQVVPVGNVDLLRPFGLAYCATERVLVLDSDETPSRALLEELPNLRSSDAYVIPRWEVGARGYTYHLRLFRRNAVQYCGPSQSFPRVNGSTKVLSRRAHIIHNVPGAPRYWNDEDRLRRYLLSDFLERPYGLDYLVRVLGFPQGKGGSLSRIRWASDPLVRITVATECLRTLLTSGSIGLARFALEQGRVRRREWEKYSESEREWVREVAARVHNAGGLIRFLGFDYVPYVNHLTKVLGTSADGPTNLEFLIRARASLNRPWTG